MDDDEIANFLGLEGPDKKFVEDFSPGSKSKFEAMSRLDAYFAGKDPYTTKDSKSNNK